VLEEPNTTDTPSIGQVLEASRRHASLLDQDGAIIAGTTSSKALEIVPGDEASFQMRDGKIFVTAIKPAKRNLYRSYRGTVKRMGANIDLLCVITAVGSTLNPVVIDRMLVAARVQAIPTILVINKADLGVAELMDLFSIYQRIGVELIACSAKFGESFDQLERRITAPHVRVAALCGVSGVGKSTILNRLVPSAKARTGDLSAKTGQGKQTTSQPRGFVYEPAGTARRIIIDFPGVQFFGLSHISVESVEAAFDEFAHFKAGCRFLDCKHLLEPQCGVRDAVERGEIAPWRYESYLQILGEIEEAREY
jgi:ribosome biogenesis GTPase